MILSVIIVGILGGAASGIMAYANWWLRHDYTQEVGEDRAEGSDTPDSRRS